MTPPATPAGYTIESHIGTGGAGTVWRAHAADGRTVALKILPALDGENLEWRFRREVEAAALQEHPGIARVLASGVHEGRPWLAMDLIEGAALDDFLAENEPPLRERLALSLAIGAAVQHAHDSGVLHRDLKPANILIRADATPVVLDFGLARFLGDTAHGPTLSLEGEAIGTPLYMAPEQAAGKMDAIGVTADVYSLGVILYEMLTDASPYDRALPPLQLLRAVCETDPRPPRAACPALDRDLEAIILRAMARDIRDRYATVTALREDVQRFLDHRPVRARRWSAGYALRRAVRRHWLPVSILALIAALTAAWLTAHRRATRPHPPSPLAARPEEKLQIAARLAADGLALAKGGDLGGAMNLYGQSYALLYGEMPRFSKNAAYHRQLARLQAGMGDALHRQKRYAESAAQFARAYADMKDAATFDHHRNPDDFLDCADYLFTIPERKMRTTAAPERFAKRLQQAARYLHDLRARPDLTPARRDRLDALEARYKKLHPDR